MREERRRMRNPTGLTLHKLVFIIMVISILSVILMAGYPFMVQREVRETSTRNALRALRSSIRRFHATSSDEAAQRRRYPTATEIREGSLFVRKELPRNTLTSSSYVFAGTPPTSCTGIEYKIMDERTDLDEKDSDRKVRPDKTNRSAVNPVGWRYHQPTGRVWAFTDNCEKSNTFDW